jgi:uncharacterized lipoprotein YmbA
VRPLPRHLLTVVSVVLVPGCTLLAPLPDRSRFFLLTPAVDVATRERVASPALVLGRVRLAPYLDRSSVATRLSTEEIHYSGRDRWAEPLDRNVARVLAVNLSRFRATEPVATGVQTLRVDVDIGRLDTTQRGEAVLTAHWRIERVEPREILLERDSHLSRTPAGSGTPAAVAALNGVLADFCEEIASAARGLPQPGVAVAGAQPRRERSSASVEIRVPRLGL